MKKYFSLTLSFLALSCSLGFSSDLQEDFLKIKNTVIKHQEENSEKQKKHLPLYDLSSEKKVKTFIRFYWS